MGRCASLLLHSPAETIAAAALVYAVRHGQRMRRQLLSARAGPPGEEAPWTSQGARPVKPFRVYKVVQR